MDFHTLPRKDLQALCKRNRIPANITNVAMADALAALANVEGMDDALTFLSPQKPEMVAADLPRTGRKTTARKVVITVPDEEKQLQASPLPRSRRVNAKVGIVNLESEEEKEVVVLEEKPETPAPRTLRRTRAVPTPVTRPTTRTKASAKGKTLAVEDGEAKVADEVAPVTVGRSTRGRATAKKAPATEEKTAVTGTRRSTRAKSVSKMSPLVQEVEESDAKDVNEDQTKDEEIEAKEIEDLATVEEMKEAAEGPDESPVWGVVEQSEEIVSIEDDSVEEVQQSLSDDIVSMEEASVEEVHQSLSEASSGETPSEESDIGVASPEAEMEPEIEESVEEIEMEIETEINVSVEEAKVETETEPEVNVSVKQVVVEISEMAASPELCLPATEEAMVEEVAEQLEVLDLDDDDDEKNNNSITATPLDKKSLRKLKSLLREKLNKQNGNKMEVKRTALAAVNENQL